MEKLKWRGIALVLGAFLTRKEGCYSGGKLRHDRHFYRSVETDVNSPHPHVQTKLRSPQTLSIRPTLGQNLCSTVQGVGKAACSRV